MTESAEPVLALSQRPPTGLLVASTLCWIWGILLGLGSIAFFLPAVAAAGFGSGARIIGSFLILLAVVYCVAGYLIRKRRLIGGWIGVVVAGFVSATQLLVRSRAGSVGLLINPAIVLLLVLNWRHFRVSARQVGA